MTRSGHNNYFNEEIDNATPLCPDCDGDLRICQHDRWPPGSPESKLSPEKRALIPRSGPKGA